MKRREFLRSGLVATGTARAPAREARRAADVVLLGPDKVKLSRLAISTGTKAFNKTSAQTRQLGIGGLADLLQFGFDHQLTFWDSADAYGTHSSLKEALKRVPREKVTIMTKTLARTAEAMKADLDRFRQEIGADYLDIVLLHAVSRPEWAEQRKGAMEVLSEAREKGVVRTHGVSCHSLDALKTVARTPWVRVALIRVNPAGENMDAGPDAVVAELKQIKAAGKGAIGMKILGEGVLRNQVDKALKYAVGLDCIDSMTIGPESRQELIELIQKMPAVSA